MLLGSGPNLYTEGRGSLVETISTEYANLITYTYNIHIDTNAPAVHAILYKFDRMTSDSVRYGIKKREPGYDETELSCSW